MTSIMHLKTAFIARIERMVIGYMAVRVVFDRYVEGSLAEKTRKKRVTYIAAVTAGHVVHNGMSINTISLKQLLSCTFTKHSRTCFGQGLLYMTLLRRPSTHGGRLKATHTRKLIHSFPCTHVILSIEECTYREVDVWSPDTDALVLLMDLVSRGHIGSLTKLKRLTGKGAKHRQIDICGRVKVVGRHKSRALLGFHHFTGTDWGGKFVGLSKKTWMTAFLSIDANDPIVETISRLGKGPISMSTDDLETFVCKVYAPKCSTRILSELRWELFRAKNLESEMLPLPLAH